MSYMTRSGQPDAIDSIVPMAYGNLAIDLIMEGKSGRMVCLKNGRYDHVPLRGVFAVLVTGVGGRTLTGIANLGHRPTVLGGKLLLEVYCFDFDQNIYGQRIQVEFCRWIRNERKFNGPEALRSQIRKDVDQTRNWFRDHLAE